MLKHVRLLNISITLIEASCPYYLGTIIIIPFIPGGRAVTFPANSFTSFLGSVVSNELVDVFESMIIFLSVAIRSSKVSMGFSY